MSQRELFFGDGKLVSLPKSPVIQEMDLEKLIVHNPDLLALPGENHKLFVVRNQFPISDEEIKNRYALDILMVRDDAVPVLVEVKRCTDTRIKREVVAQMLDYACYLSRYTLPRSGWPAMGWIAALRIDADRINRNLRFESCVIS